MAVIGRSRVAASDITTFESKTGLVTNMPNVVIPTNGVDPGTTGDDDQAEATLDVERVTGVAPGAQVDLVISRAANNYDGVFVAAQYEIQTLRDPVMNISFGECEAYGGVQGWRYGTRYSQRRRARESRYLFRRGTPGPQDATNPWRPSLRHRF